MQDAWGVPCTTPAFQATPPQQGGEFVRFRVIVIEERLVGVSGRDDRTYGRAEVGRDVPARRGGGVFDQDYEHDYDYDRVRAANSYLLTPNSSVGHQMDRWYST